MSETRRPPGVPERRQHPELRALIDEMLECVRELHRHQSMWDPEERKRAEAALERIMARVRSEAGRRDTAAPSGEVAANEEQ